MQEDLLAVQEQVVEEELAEHQHQSLLSSVLTGTIGIRHPKSRNFALKSLNYALNFTTDNN